MRESRPGKRLCLLGSMLGGLGLLFAAGASAAPKPCSPIQFEHGTTSATLRGRAPAEGVLCFTLATGAGQHATFKVTSGANTVFGIDGLVDARDAYAFITQRKTYKIDVSQLMRSVTPEAFTITVSVE